ncbi:hypothetical protein [Actinomadura sp. WMMB 499]|uniref:hypothetical protein n=1 Tax=Actinomadura sp. WMMB 499 TaxID=1219491 RepID=UPI001248493E|nr:hypothetical protein [Actinomadura sp. WMMB 499]QFG25807.1 hypothetical protein F7P10_36360 [Actinomadura sp. WMMB 499]
MENAHVEDAWVRVPGAAARWLEELDPEHGYSGFQPPSRPDAAWILHAMYAWEEGLVTTTYDDLHKSMAEAGLTRRPRLPEPVGDVSELLAGSVVTGTALGRTGHPGRGWRRLRWRELARGSGEPAVPDGRLPGSRCLRQAHPAGSWSAAIRPPAEGCLDREGWQRLIGVLLRCVPSGADTRCLAYYCPLVTNEWEEDTVLVGRLGDADALYDHPSMQSCPSNLWPEDRSWIVYCDWDLWGTKFAGPSALVDAVLADPELESLRLPWTG